MAWLAYVATAAKAYGALKGGQAAEQQAEEMAAQDRRDANSAQVASQGAAANERRRAKFLRSRALSVAGASGAGVSDPTVVDLMTDIETEGEMRALNALYEGDTEAAGLRANARTRQRMGKAARTASYLEAGSTIVTGGNGGASFFDRYG